MPLPYQNKQSRSQFFRKLGYYCVGIAIGLTAMGFFQRMRKIEMEKRAREDAARQAAPPSPLFPPPPGSTPAPADAPPATPPSPEAP